ncbi:platelet endothelial aggregation receptor 1-like isoform X1 [Erpetoichthys calabaricus]|uniref:platelet endothelial aggregation receptor 1-like isoform X1 n=2 Tax=Erpetoichthys calabaricus TaxID=27687 RepID=UPI002234DCEA|nr:platelet endothelial aggregation receptor 1-like isoform X1 [Erpetoichthys calabaricus]
MSVVFSAGITDYLHHPCPPGFWCSGSGSPILCPPGTMRPAPGGATESDCTPCAAGFYCPDPTGTGQPNLYGLPCQASKECPPGSVSEVTCRAGFYCGPQTGYPEPCPAGYFCPAGSESYDSGPQRCVFPFYCPSNSTQMSPCPGGFHPVNVSGLRDSVEKSCMICDFGTYRLGLPEETECQACPTRYFCPSGTQNYLLNPCPNGHYCPLSSGVPVPCLPGSYGNSTRASSQEDCNPCPADTFNHLFAQEACFQCGSFSFSLPGAISCMCNGLNRAFQPSDGTCICRTGFVYYDELGQKSSTGNSDADCQPELSERCASGEVRLAHSRRCVLPAVHQCASACGGRGGRLDADLGICHCQEYTSSEEVCGTTCQAQMPKIIASVTPDGPLQVSLMDQESGIIKKLRIADVLGPEGPSENPREAHFILFQPAGVYGLILLANREIEDVLSEMDPALNIERGRSSYKDTLPVISNPVICVRPQTMLIFHISIDPMSEYCWPLHLYLLCKTT